VLELEDVVRPDAKAEVPFAVDCDVDAEVFLGCEVGDELFFFMRGEILEVEVDQIDSEAKF